MRILAVADRRHRALYDYFDPERWKNIELVLSCGDLDSDYLSFLVTVIPSPLLYVPGNHDRSFIKGPPEGCDSIDGKVVKARGITVGGLGGCIWYNGQDLQYTENQMRRRASKISKQIKKIGKLDILVTHAPPKGIHDLPDPCHHGFECFRILMDYLKPRILIHGHNHEIYHKEDREMVVDGVRVINAYEYYVFDLDE